ncbi:MAG: hypothetical protein K2X27_23585 [Candidatus Obscuribacterales bacterium]|nr:hypothetical protein [Candidatus Obscuribacterales bacterium]
MIDKNKEKIERALSLMQEAYERLDAHEPARARKIGKTLLSMGFSGAYEILSLCYLQEGKPEESIKIIKDGLKKMPLAWALWRHLGNVYCDQEQFLLAHESYEKALACSGVNPDSINFESALAFYRERRYPQALDSLEKLSVDAASSSAPLKASVLNALLRHEEVIDLCSSYCKLSPDLMEAQGLSRENISSLLTEMALAQQALSRPKEALELLLEAIIWGSDAYTLSKLREMRKLLSSEAKQFRLTVSGRWNEPLRDGEEIPAFFRVFQVVADSPDEALEYAKEFEIPQIAESLQIEECIDQKAVPDVLKGVYEVWGHIFFPKE